ncbi:MAG: hypothetical protein ACFFKA_11380, partial [Candidatus Thorarchaeota archaeon]
AEDGARRITIISPSEGQRYGIIAPSFNLQIVDVKVFETWYTLDGGLHNYTFNGTGKIDQTVWDALPEGNVTIRFYVRDIIGNVAFEEVTIIKELPLDLGVLVVIIVASIIGGIAIFGAILATLVKRGKISLAKIKEFSFKKK